MIQQPEVKSPAATPALSRLLTALAVAAACALPVVLAFRPLSSPDLGYHLAYGEQFLATGQVVDSNPYVYTLRQFQPRGPQAPPPPGPGCWYDSAGAYRFPNANWLSQAVCAAVHRCGGVTGLCILQAALVGGIVAVSICTMRRLSVPWLACAAGVVLIALAAYARLNLRPEVLGYLLLAGQLLVLVRPARPADGDSAHAAGAMSWRAVWALILLQLLLVNVHSYFLLGLGLTAAVLADRLLRLGWQRLRALPGDRARQNQADLGRSMRRQMSLLAAALGGQIVACFVNPWTWRLAALPVQTLLFMNQFDISGGQGAGGGHPWSHIGEFFRPFAPGGFADVKATYAFIVLLVLAAAGMFASAARRRWDWLFILAGMTAVSLSMRRNIAPGAIILAPIALASLHSVRTGARSNRSTSLGNLFSLGFGAGLVLFSGCLIYSIATQRFYADERSPTRFGLGISRLLTPVDAAAWLSDPAHRPSGTMWTDYDSSSDLYYFTRPHRDVPILTNTWAYPPQVMAEVLGVCRGEIPFEQVQRKYNLQIVVLCVGRSSAALARRLAENASWKLVFLDGLYVVFLRADGPNAEIAAKFAISAEAFDRPEFLAAYLEHLKSLDPVGYNALHLGGLTLYHMGWDDPAINVFRAAVKENPQAHESWDMLGLCLARRGTARLERLDQLGRKDWDEARQCFLRALDVRPGYSLARDHLGLIESQIANLQKGILLKPRYD